jgi:glycosyltransferase involved in cell wall biosynthesis
MSSDEIPRTLVIQIPCFNEAPTLADTIGDLPTSLPGFSRVIVLVVDDGSTDDTAAAALASGADYVVRHRQNRGLARAYMTGLTTSLALGADVIVNTDGDHQYPGRYVAELVQPILAGEADLVIADRQPRANADFSRTKRLLEAFGSWIVRHLSHTDVRDASSGFRAYSRYAALRMHAYNDYSYTLETLIQAGRDRLALVQVPIETNPETRPSRLHTGVANFIWRQGGVILRAYVLYQPLKSFFLLGLPLVVAGSVLITRFLVYYAGGVSGARHIQSVSIGGTLLVFGALMIFLGLLGDAVRANRKVMEETLIRLRAQPSAGPPSEVDGSLLIRRESALRSGS